ncbi:MAG: choice-of-anchor tandem repeat GloVer-containing protein [Terriglobales bacterium]
MKTCDLKSRKRVATAVPGITARIGLIFLTSFSVVLMVLAVGSRSAWAQTETVLYRFCSLQYCADGTTPAAGLVMDGQGNLYGTAAGGSSSFYGGVVFEVSTKDVESLVYNFGAINEGLAPNGWLVRDSSGNFYGTTAGGGYDKGQCKRFAGCGLVYKLTGGAEQVLYNFVGGSDGQEPNGGLILDKNGNLYGTTYRGGSNGGGRPGTVFEVSAAGIETVLHRFGAGNDGKLPTSGLVMDKKGNLYGTTSAGGMDGFYGPGLSCSEHCGTVYELTAAGVEKILYSFKGWKKGGDGAAPFASLILDSSGNLYGTTYAGGTYGYGTIFKLTPSGQETVLYSFIGQPDAGNPVGRLLMDSHGNLYGTTSFGGTYGFGAVYELSASGKESLLYSFTGGSDGSSPFDGLAMDAAGNLYGTTEIGGNFNNSCPEGCGVVFKVAQ